MFKDVEIHTYNAIKISECTTIYMVKTGPISYYRGPKRKHSFFQSLLVESLVVFNSNVVSLIQQSDTEPLTIDLDN